jgi:flagellar hook-associated protein 2
MSNFGTVGIGAYGQPYFEGLVSGVQTAQIINALLAPYMEQVTAIQNQQKSYQTEISDWQSINSDLSSLQNAAQALSLASGWGAVTATSSNQAVATATAATGTPQGTVSFTVQSLASTDSWVSSGTVSSTGTVVTSNPGYLLSQASQYGFTSLAASSGLAIGAHTINVTQALSAASTTSSSLLPSSTTITSGTNNTVNLTVNGTAYALNLAAGTYTPSQLVSAINAAASAAGAPITASLTPGGYLTIATNLEGSGASLQITGGNALPSLGLSAMSSAVSGTSGSVTVDGTVNTINNVTAGTVVTLNSGTGGSISATVGNGVGNVAGTFTATNFSTGNGSLADIVANINNAGTGIVASAVQTGSGGYVLQLSSTKTGSNATITDDANAFASSGLGVMNHAAVASDAVVNVGGSYAVASQTNTVTGLLPGLSVQLLSTSSSPVTVTVSTNVQGLTTAVQNLVNAANKVLSDLNQYGGYDSSTKTAGPLLGQPQVSELSQAILSTFATVLGTSGLSSAMQAGISVVYNSSSGQTTIQFNQSAFQAELTSNPTAVQNLFAQGGTFTLTSGMGTGTVSLIAATNGTQAGSYAVNITAPATQAVDTGTQSSGTITSTETLQFKVGTATATYTTTNGESYSQVVNGLNAAFAAAGVGLAASVNASGNIVVTDQNYGSAASFTVSGASGAAGSTGLANGTFSGTDVAGTIKGVAATGSGQILSAPMSDPVLAGLTLKVTATAPGSGTFTYTPGIAQALATAANQFSNPVNGLITAAITGLNNSSNALDSQITFYQNLENSQKQALNNIFAQMESTLGVLQNQRSYLTYAINQLASMGL